MRRRRGLGRQWGREERRAPERGGASADSTAGVRIRAFLALEMSEIMRARIAELGSELSKNIASVRWVAPSSMHLTLRFLGYASPEALARIESLVRPAAAVCPPAEVPVAGLGMFPDQGAPRVLWLDVPLPPALLELQAACEEAAIASGFPPEGRPFRSHLTLGRWRDRARRPDLPHVDLGTTLFERLVLFRSDLHPTGAVYTPLATFGLGGVG